VAYGLPIARGALAYSKFIKDYNREEAQSSYRAFRDKNGWNKNP